MKAELLTNETSKTNLPGFYSDVQVFSNGLPPPWLLLALSPLHLLQIPHHPPNSHPLNIERVSLRHIAF